MIHNALHVETAPEYLKAMFSVYTPARSLRSSNNPWKLNIPASKRYYGKRSLPVFGANLWNTLPLNLRGPISRQCFKKKLKTVLFRVANDCLYDDII